MYIVALLQVHIQLSHSTIQLSEMFYGRLTDIGYSIKLCILTASQLAVNNMTIQLVSGVCAT